MQKGEGSCDPPEVIPKEIGRLWHKAPVGPLPGQVPCVQFRPPVLRSWSRCKEALQGYSGESGSTECEETRRVACVGQAKWRLKGLCTDQGKGGGRRGKCWCQRQWEGRYRWEYTPITITDTSQVGVTLSLALFRIRSQNLGSRGDTQGAPWNTFKLWVLSASENQITSLVPSSNSPTIQN